MIRAVVPRLRQRWRRPRMSLPDLLDESLSGVTARPTRLVLTTLGTVLGIAALVTTLGVGQTAASQISQTFDEAAATRVVVEPSQREVGGGEGLATQLPFDAPDRIERLNGVVAAGSFSQVDVGQAQVRGVPVIDPTGTVEHTIPVTAASPGLFPALDGTLRTGRLFDAGHDGRGDPVAVLGRYAAQRLGVERVESQPSIFIGDRAFTVVGILDGVGARAQLLDSVILPAGTAHRFYGLPAPELVEIRSELGAAQLVGEQAPIAVDPNHPENLRVDVPPRPGGLRDTVTADVNVLFLVLGGVALLIGGLGIANVTLLSVLERISEIGLRRALGATRGHVASQFLVESVVVGLLGGLIGTSAGVVVTVVVSWVQEWTPVMDPRVAVAAPLMGAVVGLAAGTYPAWRAAAIEPITALRSG